MTRPRVGFLGTGWIGRHRMQGVLETQAVEAAALVDPSPECVSQAARLAPGAAILPSLEAMLDSGIDGLVIATPSALHARQAIAALERGVAVFCQKPLGRTAQEAQRVIRHAQAADRLLAVDFSYRMTTAAERLAALVRAGELGEIFAIDAIFHNAYGPDKAWFYDRAQSGGGCVMDLGVHLVDLALWLTGFPAVENTTARLYAQGKRLPADAQQVEDFATARLDLANGVAVNLSCSWRLHAGQDAVIGISIYGTGGGASLRNVGGSFYDFELLRHHGTSSERLVAPPDEWGARAAKAWALRLAGDATFCEEALYLGQVSAVMDGIYAAANLR